MARYSYNIQSTFSPVFTFSHLNTRESGKFLESFATCRNCATFSNSPKLLSYLDDGKIYSLLLKQYSTPNEVLRTYLLSSKKNYLLHYSSTSTQLLKSNNSSPRQFLLEHLSTSLMALHLSTTFSVVSRTFFCLHRGRMETDHQAIESQTRIEIR